jgi:hypothetical protein
MQCRTSACRCSNVQGFTELRMGPSSNMHAFKATATLNILGPWAHATIGISAISAALLASKSFSHPSASEFKIIRKQGVL